MQVCATYDQHNICTLTMKYEQCLPGTKLIFAIQHIVTKMTLSVILYEISFLKRRYFILLKNIDVRYLYRIIDNSYQNDYTTTV